MRPKDDWSQREYDRYNRLVEAMAVQVVKDSNLQKLTDRTAVGIWITDIAYGIVMADFKLLPKPETT
jgi:hypothetical protein